MKGLLDRFDKFASDRLRRSQIKMLFQNQSAVAHILHEFEPARQMGDISHLQIISDLELIRDFTQDAIIQLTYQHTLPNFENKQLFESNKGLRNLYSGLQTGKRQARAQLGKDSTDLTPFEKRFMPANGWANFSDTEWDQMVSKALEGAPK